MQRAKQENMTVYLAAPDNQDNQALPCSCNKNKNKQLLQQQKRQRNKQVLHPHLNQPRNESNCA